MNDTMKDNAADLLNQSYARVGDLVLLFNTRAASHLAVRIHSAKCSMVNTAMRPGGRRMTTVVASKGTPADLLPEVLDLIEREWPVKICKCCK